MKKGGHFSVLKQDPYFADNRQGYSTSVHDGVLAGAVRLTVLLAAPPPVTMEILAGKEEVNLELLVARAVKVPPVLLAVSAVKHTEMVEKYGQNRVYTNDGLGNSSIDK